MDNIYNVGGYAAILTETEAGYQLKLISLPAITGEGETIAAAIKDAADKFNAYLATTPDDLPEPDYNRKMLECYDEIYKNVIDTFSASYNRWDNATIAEQYMYIMASLKNIQAEPTGNVKKFLNILVDLWVKNLRI